MARIPDTIAVASLDTHALIVTVPRTGPADVASSLPRSAAADVLRQIADQLEAQPCPTAAVTGMPCPVHDAPTAPAEEQQAAEEAPPAEAWVDDVRAALTFNAPDGEAALATLRDVLLDTTPRTPAQALAAARVLLAAHTRELAEQARKFAQERGAEMRERRDRSRVAACAGMHAVRRHLADHADRLDEQADQ